MDCDLLVKNGRFCTMDPARPQAKALAIKDGRIFWVGDTWTGKSAQTLDLQGAYVYPGFIDAHMHVLYTGLVKSYLQLYDCRSQEEVLQKVSEKASRVQEGDWIIGIGWDEHGWPRKDCLNADALEKAAPHNPVVLQRCDTHLMWVNRRMLRLAGVDADTPDPYGGLIGKDSQGRPNGILVDRAMLAVRNQWPLPTFAEKVEITKKVMQDFLRVGLTTVHNAATDANDLEVFEHLAEGDELPLRLYAMITVRDKQPNSLIDRGPQRYSDFFQMRCVKIWMDGAMGSRGAALFEPYHDDPDNKGLLLWEEEELLPVLDHAKRLGFQVAAHAIGDRAAHQVLDAYEKVGVHNLRWRVEHAQQLIAADIPRFGKLGVIASVQPLHAVVDGIWLEHRLGKRRVDSGAFAWERLLASGAVLAGGSDAPVVDFNPLLGIQAACAKLSRLEALRMYTVDAAYASFQETDFGSLTEGKRADLVVLPQDLLTCPLEALSSMPVLYTLVQGRIHGPWTSEAI